MMKKIKAVFALLICIAVTLSYNFSAVQSLATSNDANDYTPYNIDIYSNISSLSSSEIYQYDGKFYMSIEDIAELTRTTLSEISSCLFTEGEDFPEVFVLSQGVRNIYIQKQTGYMWDSVYYVGFYNSLNYTLNRDHIPYELPFLKIDSEYYYECIPMLEYLGAECRTSELGGIFVTMPYYTIWEAIIPEMEKYCRGTNVAKESEWEKAVNVRFDIVNDMLGDIGSIPSKLGSLKEAFKNDDSAYMEGVYLKQSLYEVFDVNVMDFDSVRQEIGKNNEETNDNLNKLFDVDDKLMDLDTSVYDLLEDLKLLDKGLLSGATKEILDVEWSLLTATIDAGITIDQRLNYDENTINCFSSVLNDEAMGYINELYFESMDGSTRSDVEEKIRETNMYFEKYGFNIAFRFEDEGLSPSWKDEALEISAILSDENKIMDETLYEKYKDSTIDFFVKFGAKEAIEFFVKKTAKSKMIGGAPASFAMFNYSIMTDVVLKDSFEASKASLYAYCLNQIQEDILLMLSFESMDAVMEDECKNTEKLEIMKILLALYYRTTIAFCQNNVKAIEEYGYGKTAREQAVDYYNKVAERCALALYRVTNCTVSDIPDYNKLSDDIITEEWLNEISSSGTDSIELYREILDMYYNHISTGWKSYSGDEAVYGIYDLSPDKVSYLWWWYNYDLSLSQAGYQLMDINNDGIDELLVGEISDYDGGASLYDLYTIYNGKIVHLVATGERDYFLIGNNNTVYEYGSGGAAYGGATYYHIENGELVPFEEYLFDEWTDENNPYFYSNEPKLITEDNGFQYYDFVNRKHITEEEWTRKAIDCVENFPKLSFTPFSKYTPENSGMVSSNNHQSNSIPQIYLNNESSWLYDESNPFAVFWFQDLDFDGINEMVYGFDVDAFSGDVYSIWENSVGGNQFTIVGVNASEALRLCYDTRKHEYFYLNEEVIGLGAEIAHYTVNKYQNLWMEAIVGYTVDNNTGTRTYYGSHDSDSIYNSASISAEEYVRLYNAFVSPLQYVHYSTEKIKVSDYIALSKEERLDILTRSYDAFQIGNAGEKVPPIELSEISDTNAWKKAYQERLENIDYMQKDGQFALINLNNDDSPDLYCRYGVKGLYGGGHSLWTYVDGEIQSVSLISRIDTDENGQIVTGYYWNGEEVNNPDAEWDSVTHYDYETIMKQLQEN